MAGTQYPLVPLFFVLAPAILIGWVATLDGRHVLDFLNRRVFPRGPAIVTDPAHSRWRRRTREAVPEIKSELRSWEVGGGGKCFPEFTSLTPKQYFPEADAADYGKAQRRTWGFLWLRLYGQDTKLASEFPDLVGLYDALPVEVFSLGISSLEPGRGDVTHFGEFRGTWRQLLTIETGRSDGSADDGVYLGLYPYGPDQCDSIWLQPDRFLSECIGRGRMNPPRIHRYVEGEDILFDDSVWHFIDNESSNRRVAIWVDVVRTDLTIWQRIILRLFMFLASHANDEVSDTVRIVNSIDYQEQCRNGRPGQASVPLDSAPKGPIEQYNRSIQVPRQTYNKPE